MTEQHASVVVLGMGLLVGVCATILLSQRDTPVILWVARGLLWLAAVVVLIAGALLLLPSVKT